MSKKTKKFALIGTSSVGKTTLILELESALKGKKVAIVEEAARYFFSRNKVDNPFSYDSQIRVQNLVKKFEEAAYKKNADIILCDRSVLDAVAYVMTVGRENEWKKLLNNVKDWLKTYDHFFLLDPNGINYRTDKVRKESKKIRESFHPSFVKLLLNLHLPHTLISGNKKERLEKMISIIL